MAAVVRVKRSLDDEPTSALILSCKRIKREDGNGDFVETIFKFAGTVKDQGENVAILTPDKLTKSDVKASSRPIPNVSKKVRFEKKASSQSNRYKLVNYYRALGNLDQSTSEEDGNQSAITVFDVEASPESKHNEEDSKTCAQGCSNKPDDGEYVYDVYYIQPSTNDIDVDDLLLDGLVSFAPAESELVFDSYRNNRAGEQDSDSDTPLMDDDDDSNDENNWRNDYPDECNGESDEDDGLATGLGKVCFGDEELSSDEDDEKLIYTEELSPSDVAMFGPAYAKYKKKILKEMNEVEVSSNCDQDKNSSGSASDSDDDIDRRFE